MTQSLSLFPTIDKPACIYGNSATSIDNIFSNAFNNFQISGNIVSDVSDYFVQVCISTLDINNFNAKLNVRMQDYRFIKDLQDLECMTIVSNQRALRASTFM